MNYKIVLAIFVGILGLSATTTQAYGFSLWDKTTICHNGENTEVGKWQVDWHLDNHEGDYRGECKQVDRCEFNPDTINYPASKWEEEQCTTCYFQNHERYAKFLDRNEEYFGGECPTPSPGPTVEPSPEPKEEEHPPADETDCANPESLDEWTRLNDCGDEPVVEEEVTVVTPKVSVKPTVVQVSAPKLEKFPTTGFDFWGLL